MPFVNISCSHSTVRSHTYSRAKQCVGIGIDCYGSQAKKLSAHTGPTRAPIYFVTNTNGLRKTVFYSLLFGYVILGNGNGSVTVCEAEQRTLWIFAVNSINSTLSALVEKMSQFFLSSFSSSFLVSSTFIP